MAKYGIWGEYLGNKTALTLKFEIRAISALLSKAVNLCPNLKFGKMWVAKNSHDICQKFSGYKLYTAKVRNLRHFSRKLTA